MMSNNPAAKSRPPVPATGPGKRSRPQVPATGQGHRSRLPGSLPASLAPCLVCANDSAAQPVIIIIIIIITIIIIVITIIIIIIIVISVAISAQAGSQCFRLRPQVAGVMKRAHDSTSSAPQQAAGSAEQPMDAAILERMDQLGHYPKRLKKPKNDMEKAENALSKKITTQWDDLLKTTQDRLRAMQAQRKS